MKSTPLKKFGPVIAIALIVIGGIFFWVNKNSSNTDEPTAAAQLKKRNISEPVNIIPLAERPYTSIRPDVDGRHLYLTIHGIKKAATEMEYELEYASGSLQQGVFGSIDISKLPATTKQLMGTCSAGGACSYHTEVTGGSLVTRFAGEQNYALKTQWRYLENKQKETKFGSTDAKFQIESPELAKAALLIIADASGYPEGLEGTAISAPYSLQTAPAVSGKATLTIRTTEEAEKAIIMGYNGSEWKAFPATITDKAATAEVDLLELYVVVAE